jgi:two-component system chemotaxis response regulator CheY
MLEAENSPVDFETLNTDGEVIQPSDHMGCEDTLLLLGGLEDHFSRSARARSPFIMQMSKVDPGLEAGGAAPERENKARVFVVDDEDFIRDLYKDVFESAGLTVFSACNGDEAVNIFKTLKSKPDIIIMDHRMPGKDGIQTTKEILMIDPSVPIIFSSADVSVREQALEAGACSFWTKPFPCSLLVNAMLDIVEARRK